jgi:hypothetical protein
MKATIRDFIPNNEWNNRYEQAQKDLLSIVKPNEELLINISDALELQKMWINHWKVEEQVGEFNINPILILARVMVMEEEKRRLD